MIYIDGNTKISDLSDDLENQNELEHKAHEHGAIDKDFYEKLPEWVKYTLDTLDEHLYGRPWFEEAWQKYRDHVINSEIKNIRAPGYIFNDYLKKDHELDPVQFRMLLEGDYYLYPELRSKKEREKDIKEVCYSEEDISSLKHFDEKEHPRGKNGQFVAKGWTKEDEKKAQLLSKQNKLMEAEAKNKQLKEAPRKEAERMLKEGYDKSIKSSQDIGKGIQDVSRAVDNIVPSKPGKTVHGSYPNLTDQEIQKRVNRMRLEQQYSDLKGDTKYVKSGEEKTHEVLQTLTAVAGLGTAVVTLALTIGGRKRHVGGGGAG